MQLPPLTVDQWLLAILAALCIGLSKSGFAGVGLVTVVIMARLFPPMESTGVLLPLLIVGDLLSVWVFHQHARWPLIWKMLPPTIIGVLIGYCAMGAMRGAVFGQIIGAIVLLMVVLHAFRQAMPDFQKNLPHTRFFAWLMGIWSGIATMLANAAGPIMALYFVAIDVPKFALVGTTAWFFLIINVFKVPFSAHLGLISPASLLFNLVLVPAVAAGIWSGQRLVGMIPQALFEKLLMLLAAVAALRLLGLF